MANNAGLLAINLKVNSAGLIEGLNVAGKTTENVAASMRTSFASTASAAKSAAKEHVGFLGVLKDFKAEQVQQARTARFFASEITSIIPASAGASSAIQGLLGAGLELAAGGGAIAVGFELTKVALEHVVGKLDLANEKAKAFRAGQFNTTESLRGSYEALADSFAKPLDKTSAAARDKAREANAEIRKLREEISVLATDNSVSAKIANAFGYANKDEIEKLEARIKGIRAGIKKGAPGAQSEAAEGERAAQAREAAAQIVQINASSADEITKIRADLSGKLKALDWDDTKFGAQAGDVRIAYERQAAEQIRRLRFDSAMKAKEAELEARRATMPAVQAIVAEANLKVEKLAEEHRRTKDAGLRAELRAEAEAIQTQAKWRIEKERETQALVRQEAINAGKFALLDYANRHLAYIEEDKKQHEASKALLLQENATLVSLGQSLASGFSTSLHEVLTGAKSVGDAMVGIFNSVVDTILAKLAEIAASAVFGFILNTISGGLGTAAFPILQGAVGKFLGFKADGGSVDGGHPYVVGERGPEVFVPGSSGAIVPNHALGGGGINLHFHGNVYDAGGVRALASDPDFIRGINEARRNGRIA